MQCPYLTCCFLCDEGTLQAMVMSLNNSGKLDILLAQVSKNVLFSPQYLLSISGSEKYWFIIFLIYMQ
jgi:hypothetical protein